MNEDKTLGIYIHIPFCASKCGYCDFYSCAGAEKLMGKYQEALLTHVRECLPQILPYYVGSGYFGGGPPSYYGAKYLCEVIELLKSSGKLLREAEITVEMNPDSMRLGDLKLLRRAGANRISMGVQSANNEILRTIGRRHTYNQAVKAYMFARQVGFENVSVDLMYGLPGQTKEDWADTLSKVIGWNPEHISCYGLKLEEGTPMYEVYHDTPVIPDDDMQADQYIYASELLERYGYQRYEISNFAHKGYESRHNLKYWKLEDYMGFGPGAHSCVGNLRYSYVRDLRRYIAGVLDGGDILDEQEAVSGIQRAYEYLMLGMRLAEGISQRDYSKQLQSDFAPLQEKLELFRDKGWVQTVGSRWAFTTSGFLLSNLLIGELLEAQAAQNAIGTPYLQEILNAMDKEELPMGEEESFLQQVLGNV